MSCKSVMTAILLSLLVEYVSSVKIDEDGTLVVKNAFQKTVEKQKCIDWDYRLFATNDDEIFKMTLYFATEFMSNDVVVTSTPDSAQNEMNVDIVHLSSESERLPLPKCHEGPTLFIFPKTSSAAERNTVKIISASGPEIEKWTDESLAKVAIFCMQEGSESRDVVAFFTLSKNHVTIKNVVDNNSKFRSTNQVEVKAHLWAARISGTLFRPTCPEGVEYVKISVTEKTKDVWNITNLNGIVAKLKGESEKTGVKMIMAAAAFVSFYKWDASKLKMVPSEGSACVVAWIVCTR